MRPDDLTPTERRVWRAFATGARAQLGDRRPGHEPERTVRADVIVALLRGGTPPDTGGPAGRVPALRLRGARITGRIDLAGADVYWLLSLYDCVLDRPPDFSHATTRTIKINNSAMPGFAAVWAHIGGHLTLNDSRINGTLELTGARVAGELRLNAARIRPAHGPGIDGGGLTVEGGCYGRGLRVSGGIRLPGGDAVRPPVFAEQPPVLGEEVTEPGRHDGHVLLCRPLPVPARHRLLRLGEGPVHGPRQARPVRELRADRHDVHDGEDAGAPVVLPQLRDVELAAHHAPEDVGHEWRGLERGAHALDGHGPVEQRRGVFVRKTPIRSPGSVMRSPRFPREIIRFYGRRR